MIFITATESELGQIVGILIDQLIKGSESKKNINSLVFIYTRKYIERKSERRSRKQSIYYSIQNNNISRNKFNQRSKR